MLSTTSSAFVAAPALDESVISEALRVRANDDGFFSLVWSVDHKIRFWDGLLVRYAS